MSKQNETVLRATNLTKYYGNSKALDSVNIEIKRGESLALLGPNGAGKTTLCEIAEGLIPQDSGDIHLFSKGWKDHKPYILENIGVCLQETRLYKKFTVIETLRLFASFYKDSQNINSLLKELGLTKHANKRLESLSGGYLQRTYLAVALINKPALLFLDEPTTGLDPHARRSIWSVLKTLKEGNTSILLTTHYMEEAAALADRIAVIDQGQIIAEGTPKELVERHCPGQLLVIEGQDLQKDALLSQLQKEFPKSISHIQKTETGLEIKTLETAKVLQYITSLWSHKSQLPSLEIRRPGLEDVFLTLTGRSLNHAE